MSARVTLTFDNGPTPGVTERVLDVLAEHEVLTTFFVVGENLRDPTGHALAERASEAGHWIGNHTLTHSTPLGDVGIGVASHEIRATQALLGELAHPDRLFRPFGAGGRLDQHLLNREAVDHLVQEAYSCILWTTVPRDWEEPHWVEVCLEDIASRDWSVVVLHDTPDACAPRLPDLLERLHGTGISVVQEFPDAVVPVRRGHPTTGLRQIVRDRSLDQRQPAC